MRSRVYIGTVFEFEDWKQTVNQLWSVAAPRALDGQLEQCPDTQKLHIQIKIWFQDMKSIK